MEPCPEIIEPLQILSLDIESIPWKQRGGSSIYLTTSQFNIES